MAIRPARPMEKELLVVINDRPSPVSEIEFQKNKMTVSVNKGTFKLVSPVLLDEVGARILRLQHAALGRPLLLLFSQNHNTAVL